MASIENTEDSILLDKNFSNKVISLDDFPRFEEVQLQDVNAKYWKIKLIHFAVFAIVLLCGWVVLAITQVWEQKYLITAGIGAVVFLILKFFYSRLAFKRLGFAFREHDVIFTYGVIAKTSVIIPYNRVQHVALHEGVLSRYFGLANVMVFTAGGSSSDISIPGILKQEAGKIKQVVMEKIKKQL